MKITIGFCLIFMFSCVAFGQQSKVKPMAETFTATSLDGKTIDLAELKGKIVVLTFWSTRCPICAAEIPKLNELAKDYQDKNVVFLGLTMDNADKVKAYLKQKSFNFNLIPDSFGVLLKYADKTGDGKISMGFPSHFVVNQKGEIALKASGYDKTELLDATLNQLSAAK